MVPEGGIGSSRSARPMLRQLPLLQQDAELAFEVRDRLEVLVDARESHVGNLVDLRETLEDLETDLLRSDLGTLAPQPFLDAIDDPLHLRLADGPVRGGLQDPRGHLVP